MHEERSLKTTLFVICEAVAIGAALLLLPVSLIDLFFGVSLLSLFAAIALVAVVATAVVTILVARRRWFGD